MQATAVRTKPSPSSVLSRRNPNIRQLLHVSFKLAAKAGQRYLNLLKSNEEIVGKHVTENSYDRRLRPLFVGGSQP